MCELAAHIKACPAFISCLCLPYTLHVQSMIFSVRPQLSDGTKPIAHSGVIQEAFISVFILHHIAVLGQVASFQRKCPPCHKYSDISTEQTPLYSLSFRPSNETNYMSPAKLWAELAYSVMLFIMLLMHSACCCRINNVIK